MTQPYARKFKAQFARQLPKNIIALVKAQQSAAIIEIADEYGVSLAPYIEFNRSVHKKVDTPCFTIYRKRVRKIENVEDHTLSSVPVFGLISTVEGADEDEAQDFSELYMQLADSIVRSASKDDMLVGLGSKRWNWEITEHIYYPNSPLGTRYRQAVEGVLEINPSEERA